MKNKAALLIAVAVSMVFFVSSSQARSGLDICPTQCPAGPAGPRGATGPAGRDGAPGTCPAVPSGDGISMSGLFQAQCSNINDSAVPVGVIGYTGTIGHEVQHFMRASDGTYSKCQRQSAGEVASLRDCTIRLVTTCSRTSSELPNP